MNSANLYTLLTKVGCGKVKQGSKWVACQCPFASMRHQKASDENPSFGISIGDNSHFFCQACGAKGTLIGLVWYWSRTHPKRDQDYWQRVFKWCLANDGSLGGLNFEPEGERKAVPKELQEASYKGWHTTDVPVEWTETFVPKVIDPPEVLPCTPEVIKYLHGPERNLTDLAIREWGLAWNEKAGRIYMPIKDWKGRLVGYTGRAFKAKKPKFLHNKGFKRDTVLFGEDKITERGGIGYVVEGNFDVIGLWQNGVRSPVALMGTYPSKYQIEKLKYFFSSLVVMGDGDKAGRELGERVEEALSPFMPVTVEHLPAGKDPDQLSFEQIMKIVNTANGS